MVGNQAQHSIDETMTVLHGLPAAIAGSAVAAAKLFPDNSGDKFSDVDVFCFTTEALIAGVERLKAAGYTVSERYERVYHRYLQYGMGSFHTNSIPVNHPTPGQPDVNLVFKRLNRQPVNSLSQVIESFDFGLLAVGGYDLVSGRYSDMRSYFFPELVAKAPPLLGRNYPLPMLPNRGEAWRNGFVSQYQGLRQPMRYIKYLDYGYNMTAVAEELTIGFRQAIEYLRERGDDDKIMLASIYQSLLTDIESDNRDGLRRYAKTFPVQDELQQILEGLNSHGQ